MLPYSVIGRQTHVEEGAVIDGSIIWPNGWIGREARSCAASILGRNCHIGRNATIETPGACSATRPSSPITAGYEHQVSSHQPVDLQGLRRPRALSVGGRTRTPRGRSAAASWPTSSAKRIAVSRDMRLSSPSVAAAFIEGAREPGRRRRRLRHDGHRHDVLRRRARRARRRRPDHGVAQSEAVQRHQDGAARGVSAERRGRASARSAT